jgi:hypothetical protein
MIPHQETLDFPKQLRLNFREAMKLAQTQNMKDNAA